MANSALVCTNSQNACTATFLLPQLKSLLKNPQGKNHPQVPSLTRKNIKQKTKNDSICDILMTITLGVNMITRQMTPFFPSTL